MLDEKTISFKDMKGRNWTFRVTVDVAMRLRDEAEFDIEKIIGNDSEALRLLIDDRWKLIQLIEIGTDEQRERLDISRKDFLSSLDGDAIIAARKAFLYGVAVCLGELKRRALESLIPELDKGLLRMSEKIAEKIESMSPEIQAEIERVGTEIVSASGV